MTVGLRERVTASVCECVFVCGAAPITQQTTTKTKRENGSDEEKRVNKCEVGESERR